MEVPDSGSGSGSGSGLSTVCVTGGSGYIASCLIKKLLLKGHTHDESKVGLLKSFPNANTKLMLFKADIYHPHEFQQSIQGCHFVFHIAAPLTHTPGSQKKKKKKQYKNRTEASVAAATMIARFSVESGTVRRVIYTGSVVSTSPMKEDGSSFKEFIDETCWTPLNLSYPYSNEVFEGYIDSKTQTEKELLRFGESEEANGLEVVTLPCGLVSGETFQSSVAIVVNSDDVEVRDIKWKSNKLVEKGFKYKYDSEMILEDALECSKKKGMTFK